MRLLIFFMRLKMSYTSKKQMLTTIESANQKLRRLRQAGWESSDTYKNVIFEVNRVQGRSGEKMLKGFSTSKKLTVKDLQVLYKTAKTIVTAPTNEQKRQGKVSPNYFNIGEMNKKYRKFIKSKTINTLSDNYNVDKKLLNKNFFSFLSSDIFAKLSEAKYITSDQIVTYLVEGLDGSFTKNEEKRLEESLQAYMENGKDRKYIEDFRDILTKKESN